MQLTVRPGPLRSALRPVPRWRLSREGPFLSEISSSNVAGFGHGCAFRSTTYRPSDYAQPSRKYGMPLYHPRFLEWIGAPESARLLDKGPSAWLHSLSCEQAIDAARQLHRDVCLMTTNLNILDQYALCLQGTASKILKLSLGSPGSSGFCSHGGHGSLAPFAGSGRLPINTPGTIVI